MGMGRFSSVKTRKLLKELTEWMANKKLVIEYEKRKFVSSHLKEMIVNTNKRRPKSFTIP